MVVWTGQCNCLDARCCHLNVPSSHFASFSGLTLLYLPARNEIIRRVDEKLTSLLHLPVALSDGCHSNHYATAQTQWVNDCFECGSLGSQPGYGGTDRPARAAAHSLHQVNSHIVCSVHIDFKWRLKLLRERLFSLYPGERDAGMVVAERGKSRKERPIPLIPISCPGQHLTWRLETE